MTSYLGPGKNFRVSGFNRTECQSLLCADCGIRVSKFNGYQWIEEKISYLFFRANFGDFDRLRDALDVNPEAAAYSCGCKGYSVDQGEPMPEGYRWKCTGCDLS
jgi:hypothetical protein